MCYLGGIWRRLEQLERIYGRFPLMDQSRRFAGVPNLGKPGGGYSHTLPIRVCAAQRGRDCEAPDLERVIHFRGVS